MATALMGLMGLVGRRIRRADGLGRGRFLDRPSRGVFEDGAGSEGMNGADSFGPRHSTSARGGLGRTGVPCVGPRWSEPARGGPLWVRVALADVAAIVGGHSGGRWPSRWLAAPRGSRKSKKCVINHCQLATACDQCGRGVFTRFAVGCAVELGVVNAALI